MYSHVAGHLQDSPNLLIDTHGEDVIDPVWALLIDAYQLYGEFPTLLERDLNIPPLDILMKEVNKITELQAVYGRGLLNEAEDFEKTRRQYLV